MGGGTVVIGKVCALIEFAGVGEGWLGTRVGGGGEKGRCDDGLCDIVARMREGSLDALTPKVRPGRAGFYCVLCVSCADAQRPTVV